MVIFIEKNNTDIFYKKKVDARWFFHVSTFILLGHMRLGLFWENRGGGRTTSKNGMFPY